MGNFWDENADTYAKTNPNPTASSSGGIAKLDEEFSSAINALHDRIGRLSQELQPFCVSEVTEKLSSPVVPHDTEFETMFYSHLSSLNYAYQRLLDLQDRLRV